MPHFDVYLPDDLADAVRDAGLPVADICRRALEHAVDRNTDDLSTDLDTQLPMFTGRAREVVRLAAGAALRHPGTHAGTEAQATIGSGDLLTGILLEGGNLALQVLSAMELPAEHIRRELDRHHRSGAHESGAPASPEAQGCHFSVAAANARELAVAEAASFGHNYVGCEHLLIGLATEPDGVAGQVLRALGGDARLLRRAVTAALAGYVHLRAQAAAPEQATTMLAAVHEELRPLVERIEQLEARLGSAP